MFNVLMQSFSRFRQLWKGQDELMDKDLGDFYWFLQYGTHLKKKKNLNIIPNLLCCIILSQLKTKNKKDEVEQKTKISLALVHFHISSQQLNNIILISYLLHENLTIESQVSTFFFFVKKEHKRTRIDKLWF
jgi:hypothetical protein